MNNDSEMPVVMFTNYKRTDGFEVSITLRGTELAKVAGDLDKAIKAITEKGGTPVIRNSGFKKPEVPTKPCPKHNVPMKERPGRNGKPNFWSHSQGVYPNLEWCTNGSGFPSELNQTIDDVFTQNE